MTTLELRLTEIQKASKGATYDQVVRVYETFLTVLHDNKEQALKSTAQMYSSNGVDTSMQFDGKNFTFINGEKTP